MKFIIHFCFAVILFRWGRFIEALDDHRVLRRRHVPRAVVAQDSEVATSRQKDDAPQQFGENENTLTLAQVFHDTDEDAATQKGFWNRILQGGGMSMTAPPVVTPTTSPGLGATPTMSPTNAPITSTPDSSPPTRQPVSMPTSTPTKSPTSQPTTTPTLTPTTLEQTIAPSSTAAVSTVWEEMTTAIQASQPGDLTGSAISINGDGTCMAVGSAGADTVRVYQRSDPSQDWQQLGNDIVGADGSMFGFSVAVNDDCTITVCGAPEANAMAGTVTAYTSSGGIWVVYGGGSIAGQNAGDRSGFSVSVSGDGLTMAVGCPYSDIAGVDSGVVLVFILDLSTQMWIQFGNVIEGEAAGDLCGYSVSLSGDGRTIAFGLPGSDVAFANGGRVIICVWDGLVWIQLGDPIDGDGPGYECGFSVLLSRDGRTIIFGLPGGFVARVGAGAGIIRVCILQGGIWIAQGQDITGEGAGYNIGRRLTLAANGSTLAFYAGPFLSNGSVAGGRVFVCVYNGSIWLQFGPTIIIRNGGPSFPFVVGLSRSGRVVVIGSVGSSKIGAVNTFDAVTSTFVPSQSPTVVAPECCDLPSGFDAAGNHYGVFSGLVTQNNAWTYPVTITYSPLGVTTDYPSLECGNTMPSTPNIGEGLLQWIEVIDYGRTRCLSGGELRLAYISETVFSYSWTLNFIRVRGNIAFQCSNMCLGTPLPVASPTASMPSFQSTRFPTKAPTPAPFMPDLPPSNTKNWDLLGDFISGSTPSFGTFSSLSANGTVVALGVPSNVVGRAQVFRYNKTTDTWLPMGQYFGVDPQYPDRFVAGDLNPTATHFAGAFITSENKLVVRVYDLSGEVLVPWSSDVEIDALDYTPSLAISSSGWNFTLGISENLTTPAGQTFSGYVAMYGYSAGEFVENHRLVGTGEGVTIGQNIAMSADAAYVATTGSTPNLESGDGFVRTYFKPSIDLQPQQISGDLFTDAVSREISISTDGQKLAYQVGSIGFFWRLEGLPSLSPVWTSRGSVPSPFFARYMCVSANGDVVAFGAPGNGEEPSTGNISVWESQNQTGAWIERPRISNDLDEVSGLGSGCSLSADGTIVASGTFPATTGAGVWEYS